MGSSSYGVKPNAYAWPCCSLAEFDMVDMLGSRTIPVTR